MKSIIFIHGIERSGSTIIQNILSTQNNFFAVGELKSLSLVLKKRRLCGCGKQLRECSFWNSILDKVDSSLIKSENIIGRDRLLLVDLIFSKSSKYKKRKKIISTKLEKLYNLICEQSNCNVIIDSSKSMMYSKLLSMFDEYNTKYIFVIRDLRAVFYSILKRSRYRSVFNFFLFLVVIQKYFLIYKIYPKLIPKEKRIFIKYEDVIGKNDNVIRQIDSFFNCNILKILKNENIKFKKTHTVGGSPSRHKTQDFELYLDKSWEENLSILWVILCNITLKFFFKDMYRIK